MNNQINEYKSIFPIYQNASTIYEGVNTLTRTPPSYPRIGRLYWDGNGLVTDGMISYLREECPRMASLFDSYNLKA